MVCPFCMSQKTSVVNSRSTTKLNNVWRRRSCNECKRIFTTTESIDPASVIKIRSGKLLQDFSQAKLTISVLGACDHLEDPKTAAHYITSNIMQKLYRTAATQPQGISVQDIVTTTLNTLKPYNLAAYVKYLSYHAPHVDSRTLKKQL